MKTKKFRHKVIAVVFALSLLLSVSVSFAAEPTAFCDKTEAKYGDIIEYTVHLENNPGLASFLVNLEYDTSVFSLVEEDGEFAVTRGSFSDEGTIIANQIEKGCKVMWFNAVNSRKDGSLFTIKLKVIDEKASGDYKIGISFSEKDTLDENCNPVSIDCSSGCISVKGNGESESTSFSDLPENHWAYNYVMSLCESGIINGFEDGTFRPGESVTRAQLVKMLACMSGEQFSDKKSSFTDVAENAWYAPYVVWASKNGIVKGVSATEFNPDGAITREQIAAMVFRYCNYKGIELENSVEARNFTDQKEISSYAVEAISALKNAGIINGYEDGSFRPQKNVSRAEAAKMLDGIK